MSSLDHLREMFAAPAEAPAPARGDSEIRIIPPGAPVPVVEPWRQQRAYVDAWADILKFGLDEERPFKLSFEPGYTECRPYDPGDLCGGCDSCLMAQYFHSEDVDRLRRNDFQKRLAVSYVVVRARTSAAELWGDLKRAARPG